MSKTKKQFIIAAAVSALALFVLITSIFRSASVRHSANVQNTTPIVAEDSKEINYELPYPGRVRPDSPLWPAKVTRDRVWIGLTTNPLKKAEIALLLSDKRLSASIDIFEKGEVNLGVAIIERSELYLVDSLDYALIAHTNGMDTKEFFNRLALASLKHREVLESIHEASPDEVRPFLIQKMDYSKQVFAKANQTLQDMGEKEISNPF